MTSEQFNMCTKNLPTVTKVRKIEILVDADTERKGLYKNLEEGIACCMFVRPETMHRAPLL